MLVAWTTVTHRADADRIAAEVITRNLASCVQVDGPIVSHYRWNDRIESAEEYRLTFKFLQSQAGALEAHVLASHPYDTPEWVVVRADWVSEKYLSWANTNSSNPPL